MSMRRRLLCLLCPIGALALPGAVWAAPLCKSYETSEAIALADELEEISGLALSRQNPKYYWAHTDSGGESALYVLNASGELKTKLPVLGAVNKDWEDIAVGPCEKGSEETCIYIGDMGDNDFVRTDKKIYIVKEPRLPDEITPDAKIDELFVRDTIYIKYPQSDRDAKFANPDCESLMVSPQGEIYAVSKQSSGGEQTLYHIRRDGDRKGEAEPLASYAFKSAIGQVTALFNAVTAADFAPDGTRFAVRTYAHVYEYDLDKYPDMAECFKHPRTVIAASSELQGESLAYMPDGKSFVTAAEKYNKLETLTALMHTHACQTEASSAQKVNIDPKYKMTSGLRRVLESVATRAKTGE